MKALIQHKDKHCEHIIETIVIKAPWLLANCKSLGKKTCTEFISNGLLNWQSSITNYYYLDEKKFFFSVYYYYYYFVCVWNFQCSLPNFGNIKAQWQIQEAHVVAEQETLNISSYNTAHINVTKNKQYSIATNAIEHRWGCPWPPILFELRDRVRSSKIRALQFNCGRTTKRKEDIEGSGLVA